jgi:DNA-binding XRE family transcriptional regulator
MHYTQFFRTLRESKGLTHDGLARMAGCHRNTVINVEKGRPVKFKTIAELMGKMGYPLESAETKSIALLWTESVSGIDLTSEQTVAETRGKIAHYRAQEEDAAQQLAETVLARRLALKQLQTLLFAARHPEALTLLENIQELLSSPRTAPEPDLQLKVAGHG